MRSPATLTRLALFSLAFLASPALAQAGPAESPDRVEDADSLARVSDQIYIFGEGDELDGEVLRPTGDHVMSNPRNRFPSMIRVRAAFIDKLHDQARDM